MEYGIAAAKDAGRTVEMRTLGPELLAELDALVAKDNTLNEEFHI